MRTLLALALVLTACGRADRRDRVAAHDGPSSSTSRGPDPIVVRVPRNGGLVRAYQYPKLDSLIWTSSSAAPAPARVLAFDDNAGSLALVDRGGQPVRIDLRRGDVTTATKAKLAALTSADGWAIYGVANNGAVTRLTPTGDWSFTPRQRARQVVAGDDGSLLVLTDVARGMSLLRLRPPDTTVTATAEMPSTQRALPTKVGDRVYFVVDSGLVGVRARDLTPVPHIRFARQVRALAPTPSGDRIYVLARDGSEVAVIDRYRDAVESRITLPAPASELRIDPIGRYLLVRAERGDSAWVIAVGTGQVKGSVRTAWLADLPFVAPDGAIALAQGDDVLFVDGETLRERTAVRGGARDFWYLFMWNGFRPRAEGLDTAVTFTTIDSSDSALHSAADSAALWSGVRDTHAVAPSRSDTARRDAAHEPVFSVQFAALLDESRARELAAEISVGGQQARVVTSTTSGTKIHRVLLGPYHTREDADRVGRESRRQYWIFEGVP